MNQKIWVELDCKELQQISGGDEGNRQGFVWWLIDKFFS
jgi:bacteriocin-like protein